MDTLQQLHKEWASFREMLAKKIDQSETGHVIYSDSQFAMAAWHNKLKNWRAELDRLMSDYPTFHGDEFPTPMNGTGFLDERLDPRPFESDQTNPR
jgi:hypothetical protein